MVAPQNDKYYQTLPNVFNVSSIYGLPLYITKNHFMNATEWLDKVVIYNEDHSIHYQQVSKWDETFILVEVHHILCSHTQEFPSKAAYISRTIITTTKTHSTNTPKMSSFPSSPSQEVET